MKILLTMIPHTASIKETEVDHLLWRRDGTHLVGGGSREFEIQKDF
jgi:hypothetical protein